MQYYLKPLSCLAVALNIATSAMAADLIADGKHFYETSDFEKARQCFETQISHKPKDATAHYLLGNVFVALRRNGDAAKEYQTAADLDPSGTVGKYSRLGLSNLANKTNQAQRESAAQRAPAVTTTPALQPSSEAQKSAAETAEVERLTAERDGKIAEIRKDSEERISRLQDQMRSSIDANGRPLRARGRNYYDPADANTEIKNEFEPQISAIKSDTQKRIEQVRSLYGQKLSSVKK